MLPQENLLFSHDQIQKKIQRMACEIYEHHVDESLLYLAGIHDTGYFLAEALKQELEKISPLQVHLLEVKLDKTDPLQGQLATSIPVASLANNPLLIVDDVLNTGKTLAYCIRHFLAVTTKKMQVAVLIDRDHHMFPVSADFVGYGLSTTISQHVKVVLNTDHTFSAYLF
jgi:pyrimidine operon attenuation protein/uracil phosphoribosyltransferase